MFEVKRLEGSWVAVTTLFWVQNAVDAVVVLFILLYSIYTMTKVKPLKFNFGLDFDLKKIQM